MRDPLVQQAIEMAFVLDAETTALGRESGLHQLSGYNVAKGELTQWHVAPNLSIAAGSLGQDTSRFATTGREKFFSHPVAKGGIWRDVLIVQSLINTQSKERVIQAMKGDVDPAVRRAAQDIQRRGIMSITPDNIPWRVIEEEMKISGRFLKGELESGKFPLLTGGKEPADELIFAELRRKAPELRNFKSFKVTAEELLQHESSLMRQLKNKVLWIQNVQFEGKSLGTKQAVIEAELRDRALMEKWSQEKLAKEIHTSQGFRSVLAATPLQSQDAFYVTGREVNQARIKARQTGDWSGVFGAILRHSKGGDVRDIQDLFRSQQSMLQKVGLLQGKAPYAFSADVQARLYGFSAARTKEEAILALVTGESHIAREDVLLTETPSFKHAMDQNFALDETIRGTEKGRQYAAQARVKSGPLYSAVRYATALGHLTPIDLQENLLQQRVGKALEDFSLRKLEGKTPFVYQVSHYVTNTKTQVTPKGELIKEVIESPRRRMFTELDELFPHIASRPEYVDEERSTAFVSKLRAQLVEEGVLEEIAGEAHLKDRRMAKKLYERATLLQEEGKANIGKAFEKLARSEDRIAEVLMQAEQKATQFRLDSRVAFTPEFSTRAWKMFGVAAAGMAVAGAFGALFDMKQQREGPETFRNISYARWLENQERMYGMQGPMRRDPKNPNIFEITGLPKGGLAAAYNRQATDFGSPYQGPSVSNSVFTQTDLLSERERYMRSAFAGRHYDPAGDIGEYLTRSIYNKGGDPYLHPLHFAKNVLLHNRLSGTNHSFFPGSDMDRVEGGQFAGLRGKNLLQIDLSSGKWKVTADDADTITVSRRGPTGAIKAFFGQGENYKFRLAGIDSPEVEHAGGSGYHRAQPYANAAHQAAKGMVEGARNLQIVVDPSNITYGRQVATIFDDGRNLNLEFIRRGMAAYLPFKKKDTQQMYNFASYKAAQTMAQSADIGMWNTPFFQAYADIVESSGQTITFNTLTQVKKLAENSSLMSIASIVHNAEDTGFYSNALAAEAAETGQLIRDIGKKRGGKRGSPFAKDFLSSEWKEHHTFSTRPPAPHRSYMDELTVETSDLMKTRGSKVNRNPLSQKRTGHLDKAMVIDSLTSTAVWNKRRYHAYELYKTKNRRDTRAKTMELMQQEINHNMFNSPIGHFRM